MNQKIEIDPEILKAYVCDIARRDLYYFCRLMLPKFYLENRDHLKILCNTIQEFLESETSKGLIINLPPRHGKTLTVELASVWWIGLNPESGVMIASYNELLAGRFSKTVRNLIQEKSTGKGIVFQDIFPGISIRDGDAAQNMWALNGSHLSFLATSPGGTATGAGCQLLVIDDLIKNAEESNNERVLEGHEDWYRNTIKSRLEIGAKQIIIQTRWASKDLTGRLLVTEPEKWKPIKMPAFDGVKMLDETILTMEEYLDRKKTTDPVIFASNYDQEPFDSKNRLYENFRTYNPGEAPEKFDRIEAYTDTADEGGDSFSGGVYGVKGQQAWILDILHTKKPMEYTENEWAKIITYWETWKNFIESNNGGRGFARTIETKIRALGNLRTQIKWFHQSGNKVSRILTNSAAVQNVIFLPHDWDSRWPEFASELKGMGRSERWEHDDAADMLTGIVEKSLLKKGISAGSPL